MNLSRINGSADTVFPAMVLFVGLAGYLLVDFIRRRMPRKDRCVPLTRGWIIFLVWGSEVLRMAVLATALCMLPTLAFLYGRINWGGLIGSICVMLLLALLPFLEYIRLRWDTIRFLYGRHIPLPENAELENTDGTWTYRDENWYIRMNRNICALLYAPQINFETPVQFAEKLGYPGRRLCRLCFESQDGNPWFVLHVKDAQIEKWVQQHKGFFFKKPAPRKPYRKKRK